MLKLTKCLIVGAFAPTNLFIMGILSGIFNTLTGDGLLGAGSGLLGGIFGQSKQSAEAERNRQFQREEREATQQFNIDMWNMNNEYNNLENQLKRARDAGVSPNAIIGGSSPQSFSNPVTSSPMSGNVAQLPPLFDPNLAMLMSNVTLNKTQSDLNQSQTGLNDQLWEWNEQTKDERMKQLQNMTKEQEAGIRDVLSSAGLKDVQRKEIEAMLPYIADKNQAELSEMIARTNVLRNQEKLLEEQRKTERKSRELIDSQIAHTDAMTDNTIQDTTLKFNQSADVHNDAQLKKIRIDFSNAIGVPVDTPQYEFYYKLHQEGKLEEFLSAVTLATLKPSDYVSAPMSIDFVNPLPTSTSGREIKRRSRRVLTPSNSPRTNGGYPPIPGRR